MKQHTKLGSPPPHNMPHCNPKWLRKQERKRLEAEAREVEMKIAAEYESLKEALEEKVRSAKLAAVEAYLNILGGLKARARRLKGFGAQV